jgi:hypothetical protein
MEGIHDQPPDEWNKDYTVRRHPDEALDQSSYSIMTQKGAASTTKKIVNQSVESRKRMAGFDPVLN